MGILIGCEHLSHEWPGKKVLEDQTIGINEGERIGIVGRNGDGKSTLLQLIARQVTPDDGNVTWRNGITVGMVGQADELADSDTVVHAIFGDEPEYVWASDPKVRSILDELMADIDLRGTVGELSGLGPRAGGYLGRHPHGRAHQPPGHARHHLAGQPPEAPLAGRNGRPLGGHARPLVPGRGVRAHVGGARRRHRPL